jgi:hypothetical protein
MALEQEEYNDFRNAILLALKELNSDELVYTSEWIFLHPSHSLKSII